MRKFVNTGEAVLYRTKAVGTVRSLVYLKSGADGIYVEAPENLKQLEQVSREFRKARSTLSLSAESQAVSTYGAGTRQPTVDLTRTGLCRLSTV